MAKEKDLREPFHDTLKDIYFAEKKILSALPKMAKAGNSDQLRTAFEKHETETQAQLERLDQVFKELAEMPGGKTCVAIIGILENAFALFRGAIYSVERYFTAQHNFSESCREAYIRPFSNPSDTFGHPADRGRFGSLRPMALTGSAEAANGLF